MKIYHSLVAPVAASVLMALAGTPASAQDAVMLSAPTTTSLTTSSDSGVPITGIVSGQPESVSFSGQAEIKSRLVKDPDFGRPSVQFRIDLSGVSGVGSSTNATYVVSVQQNVQRPLAATHQVEITFPFLKSGSTDLTSARAGVASFALDVDVTTGAITNATGNVSSPAF